MPQTTLKLTLKVSSCTECPFHEVVSDPDPYDSFCAHEQAILCTKVPADWSGYTSARHHRKRWQHKAIDTCRGAFEKKPEVPDWCPLRAT